MSEGIILYSFIDACNLPEATIFANFSMRGYVFAIVNNDMFILKPKGWEVNCNPVSQVGMKRFIILKECAWRPELLDFAYSRKNK